jgi:hypothetical protein
MLHPVKAGISQVIQRRLATVLLGDHMIKFIADKIGCFRQKAVFTASLSTFLYLGTEGTYVDSWHYELACSSCMARILNLRTNRLMHSYSSNSADSAGVS